MLLAVIHGYDDAEKRKQSENQKCFARGNGGSRSVASTARRSALIKLDRAPKDEDERPPVPDEMGDVKAAVVVEEQQHAGADESETGKRRHTAQAGIRHKSLLPLPRTRERILRQTLCSAGRARRGNRGKGTINVTIHWCERRSETHDANDDQNNREGVAE